MNKKIIIMLLLSFAITIQADVPKKYLLDMVNNINKSVPVMIDKDTRLDTTMSIGTNNVTYQYTMINLTKSHWTNISETKRVMQNQMEQINCQDEKSIVRQFGVTMVYKYRDMNYVPILETKVDKEICKKYYKGGIQ